MTKGHRISLALALLNLSLAIIHATQGHLLGMAVNLVVAIVMLASFCAFD